MRFEWDAAKDRANRDKHGLSFDEAAALFTGGADYLEIYDDRHSDAEDRFIAVGRIQRGVIVVVYTAPEEDVLRIVSARMATRSERREYEKQEKDGPGR